MYADDMSVLIIGQDINEFCITALENTGLVDQYFEVWIILGWIL
jgi:hypothetical protein